MLNKASWLLRNLCCVRLHLRWKKQTVFSVVLPSKTIFTSCCFLPLFRKTFLFLFCTIFVFHEPSSRYTQDDSSLKSYLRYELMIKIYNICWFSKRVIIGVVLLPNCLYVLLSGRINKVGNKRRGEAFL